MVIGSIIVAINLLVLGFTREIVGWVMKEDEAAKRPTIVLAVLAIYVVDFAINAGWYSQHTRCLCLLANRLSHVMRKESRCRYSTIG